jgi:hypothetical protein
MQKHIINTFATAASFIFLNLFLVSCSKDVDYSTKRQALAMTNSEPTITSTTTTTATTTNTTNTTTVNWNIANGIYGYTQSLVDFKSVSYWDGGTRSQVASNVLKTTLAANVLGPAGGVMSKIDATDGTEYQLSFNMMFDQNFDFSWGGKVGFGFLIGNGYTGGTPGWDGNGGSFRLMWYKNTSTSPVILKPYVYHKDQPGTYGNDFGKAYPSNGTSIQKGIWYNVQMYMKSNTGSNTDGRVKLVINGTVLLDQAIRWTTNDLNRMVKYISFENFRGGAESYWMSSTNGDIYFDNLSYTVLKP